MEAPPFVCSLAFAFVSQVYSNTPETINLIIEVFVEVAHKQICYLGEVSHAALLQPFHLASLSY